MAFRCVKEMACSVEWYRIKVGVLLGLWSVRVNALCDLLSNVWTRSFKSGSDVSCWGEVVRVAMLGPSVMVLMVMVMVMVRVMVMFGNSVGVYCVHVYEEEGLLCAAVGATQ